MLIRLSIRDIVLIDRLDIDFAAGLSGYIQSPVMVWPIAAVGLLSASLAENSVILRRTIGRGHTVLAYDALTRSALNATLATGGAYWAGIGIRMLSGL